MEEEDVSKVNMN